MYLIPLLPCPKLCCYFLAFPFVSRNNTICSYNYSVGRHILRHNCTCSDIRVFAHQQSHPQQLLRRQQLLLVLCVVLAHQFPKAHAVEYIHEQAVPLRLPHRQLLAALHTKPATLAYAPIVTRSQTKALYIIRV